MGRVDTEMEELKDIVGLVTGNVTSKTYRGQLKLYLDLMKKFGDVTYALDDLNARVQKLQTKFIELGRYLFTIDIFYLSSGISFFIYMPFFAKVILGK